MPISDNELKRLIEIIGQCQARNMAHDYILMEIVSELAADKDDPHSYIAAMYERVTARYEKTGPIEQQAHPVSAEVRWSFDNFFSLAEKRANRRAQK